MLSGAFFVGSYIFGRWVTVDDFYKAGVFGAIETALFTVLGTLVVYHLGRFAGRVCVEESRSRLGLVLVTVVVATVFALQLADTSGDIEVNCDPLRGGNCEYIEVGPEQTLSVDEKLRNATLIFFGISVPGLVGVRKGFSEAGKAKARTQDTAD